jgi:hypothetical protein
MVALHIAAMREAARIGRKLVSFRQRSQKKVAMITPPFVLPELARNINPSSMAIPTN